MPPSLRLDFAHAEGRPFDWSFHVANGGWLHHTLEVYKISLFALASEFARDFPKEDGALGVAKTGSASRLFGARDGCREAAGHQPTPRGVTN